MLLHEIDRLATGIVTVAMLAPVLRMAGRHVQIDRLRGHTHRPRLYHERLGVEEGRRRNVADVKAAIKTWLANADRHASGGRTPA